MRVASHRDAQVIAALEAFAEGRAVPPVEPAPAGPLERLRAAADVLAAAQATPLPARPFVIELFRSQHEFNHRVVDLLEDLAWFGEHAARPQYVSARLIDAARLRLEVPRRPGVKGTLVSSAKRAFGAAATHLLWVWLQALERSNHALIEAISVPWSGSSAAFARALGHVPDLPLAPLQSQRAFVELTATLVRELGPRLEGAPPPLALGEAAACPGLSVVLVGSPTKPVALPGVLEVLCEAVPAGSGPHVRVGDVADARGQWVLRLPVDERFHPGPGFAAALEGAAALVYGDAVVAGAPVLRPGWSPEHLWSTTYVGGCFAVRTRVARAAALSRARPALDWLLAPRFSGESVVRVPEFVSSRAEPAPVDVDRELRLVAADLARKGLTGHVEVRGEAREVRLVPRPERVSIIVPFRDKVELLRGLWASLLAHDPCVDWELLLVSNESQAPETFAFLESLRDERVRVLEWNEPFNFSTINNVAARQATGRWLLFLNNDVEARQEGWLRELLGYAQVPGVGVVGARLHYGDGSLQHAGVVIGMKGLAGHVHARWRPEYGTPLFGSPLVTRNWSAVTGACVLIERERFERIGGFDESLRISGGDIELCLRACRDGSRVVVPGHVGLLHFESVSRGREPVPLGDVRGEVKAYLPLLVTGDPAWHPRLSLEATSGAFSLGEAAPLERALRVISSRQSA